jgi:hypothetical protein
MLANGQWKKYYARLCVGCYASRIAPLETLDFSGDTRLTCPSCGIDTEDDYDAVYTTAFPGGGQTDSSAPFCGVHAAEYRIWVTGLARDMDVVDGAPEPHQQRATAASTLRSLGRQVA